MESSVSAIAAVRNPKSPSLLREPSIQVHDTRNIAPIDTLTARRLSGSQEFRVSKTASMPRAAAERKIAPMLVVSTTPSITTIRLASRHTSSTLLNSGRRMAQSTPRVSVYPVSKASISRLPV